MIIFVGDFVRDVRTDSWNRVQDTDGEMLLLEDGTYLWPDEGDIAEVMDKKTYWKTVLK